MARSDPEPKVKVDQEGQVESPPPRPGGRARAPSYRPMAAPETAAEAGLLGPDEGPSPEASSPDSTPSPSRQQPDFSWGPGGGSTHEVKPLLSHRPDARHGGHPEPPAKRAEPRVGAGQWRTLVSWKTLSGLLALILVIVCGLWFNNLLSDAGGSGEPREPCPEVWMYYDKHCYYYAENETDWKSAKKSCEANLASLVTFRDRLEMDFILKRAGKRSYWVGLRKREKGLEWITGDLLDHKQFQTQGDEECGFIWSKNGLVISLSTCSLPRSSICKREPYS